MWLFTTFWKSLILIKYEVRNDLCYLLSSVPTGRIISAGSCLAAGLGSTCSVWATWPGLPCACWIWSTLCVHRRATHISLPTIYSARRGFTLVYLWAVELAIARRAHDLRSSMIELLHNALSFAVWTGASEFHRLASILKAGTLDAHRLWLPHVGRRSIHRGVSLWCSLLLALFLICASQTHIAVLFNTHNLTLTAFRLAFEAILGTC